MASSLDQLLSSPDHYLHSFEGDQAIFVPMDRAAYRRSIFLDRRISPARDGATAIALCDALSHGPTRQTSNWIFHVAHCGSTLLARALDALSDDLVLREPLALRQLALAPNPESLQLALALLSRRYANAGPTLIKANVPVNFLLDDILCRQSADGAIFLYSTLPDYLLAILRSDNHRAWLRNVTGQLAPYLGDLSRLSDAELGAALWIAQLRQFAAAIARMPHARSLDAERFFGEPAAIMALAAAHFGRTSDPAAIDALTSGPLFNSYSKNPAHAFDNMARLARKDRLATQMVNEIAHAEKWIGSNAPDAGTVLAQLERAALRG
jgi:hypothetical protein